MKCPVCSNDLHEFNAGSAVIHVCSDGCTGMWFEKEELAKCDEHHEPFPEELLRMRKPHNVVVDRSKRRSCPHCSGQVMERVVLDPETRLEIDHCPVCHGHWLDVGELAVIRKENREAVEIAARIEAYNRRAAEQIKDVDERYRLTSLLRAVTR